MDETSTTTDPVSGLHYRFRLPAELGGPPLLLFHGLTGDEDVMWVLEAGLPETGLVAAPRAPYAYDGGGYSWVPDPDHAAMADYKASADQVGSWIQSLGQAMAFDPSTAVFVGFSQGSAVAFTAALLPAVRPAAVVALAGYLPAGDFSSLRGLPVFWGHGTQDDRVPIVRARADAARLEGFGANVQFCEAKVGHKVGVECMRGLKGWLARILAAQA